MTDHTPTPDEPVAPSPARRSTMVYPWSRERMEGQFRFAVFIVLLVVGTIATLRAYLALESAMLVWLRPQWVPLAQAVFSFLILGVCVWLIRSWVIARGE